ncbi:MAG: porin [Pseudomonadota bacterium]
MHPFLRPASGILLPLLLSAAGASAETTVSGLVDLYAGSLRYSGDTTSRTVVNSNGMTTSWIGFHSSEDLGSGLRADVAVSGFLRADTGASGRFAAPPETMWSREAFVSLTGGFGTIALGQNLAPHFLPAVLFNPFGNSYTLSPLNLHMDVPLFNASNWTNSVGGDTGWSNQVLYTSPTLGGATVNLHYQPGETAGKSRRNVGANVLYAAGPLALTAFAQRLEVNNPLDLTPGVVQAGTVAPFASGLTAARQNAWMAGASYDFGIAKGYATYGRSSHDIDLVDRTASLGASVPLGLGKIMAGWADTRRSGAAFGPRQKRDTVSAGYDYDLSKRSDLYAVVMNDRISGQGSGTSLALGMRQRF